MSCAGAIATLRYLDEHELQHNSLAMGRRLRAHLDAAASGVECIAEVRGKGLMQAIETVEPGSLSPSVDRAARLSEGCKSRSLLIGKGGLYGNVLRIAPPLTVTAEEVDRAGAIIAEVIAEID